MSKKMWILFAIASVLFGCNNPQKNTVMDDLTNETITMTVNQFLENAEELVGKDIKIQGTVSHACKHGGKRMFIFEDNENMRAKIEAGKDLTFDASLEGSDVLVSGTVKVLKIDEAYLAEWEQEVMSEMENPEHEADSTHTAEHASGGLGESADQGEHIDALESIEKYRNQIKDSGKDHLAFYSVEAISYEVLVSDTIQ